MCVYFVCGRKKRAMLTLSYDIEKIHVSTCVSVCVCVCVNSTQFKINGKENNIKNECGHKKKSVRERWESPKQIERKKKIIKKS